MDRLRRLGAISCLALSLGACGAPSDTSGGGSGADSTEAASAHWHTVAQAQGGPIAVAVTPSRVVWATQPSASVTPGGPELAQIFTAPLAGGTPQEIFRQDVSATFAWVEWLAADGDTVWFLQDAQLYQTAINAADPGSSATHPIFSWPAGSHKIVAANNVAMRGDTIYFLAIDGDHVDRTTFAAPAAVWSVPRDGSAGATRLTPHDFTEPTDIGGVAGFTVDATGVYWMDQTGIYRVPLGAPTDPERLIEFAPRDTFRVGPDGLAVGGAGPSVYWCDANEAGNTWTLYTLRAGARTPVTLIAADPTAYSFNHAQVAGGTLFWDTVVQPDPQHTAHSQVWALDLTCSDCPATRVLDTAANVLSFAATDSRIFWGAAARVPQPNAPANWTNDGRVWSMPRPL